MIKIAVLGAASKMGTRINRSLPDEPECEVLCVEGNAEGEQRLPARDDRAEAARDFLLGHIFGELGILFDKAGFPFSDGAKKAIAEAKKDIFQPDWKKVFNPEALRRSVAKITGQVPG